MKIGLDKNSLLLPPLPVGTPSLPLAGHFRYYNDTNGVLTRVDSAGNAVVIAPAGIEDVGGLNGTSGQLWTADGANGAAWQDAPFDDGAVIVAPIGGDYTTVEAALAANTGVTGTLMIRVFGNVVESAISVTLAADRLLVVITPNAYWELGDDVAITVLRMIVVGQGAAYSLLGGSQQVQFNDAITFAVTNELYLLNFNYYTAGLGKSGDVVVSGTNVTIERVGWGGFSGGNDIEIVHTSNLWMLYCNCPNLNIDASTSSNPSRIKHSHIQDFYSSVAKVIGAGEWIYSYFESVTNNVTTPATGYNEIIATPAP